MTKEEARDWNYKNFRSDCINDFIEKIYNHFEAQLSYQKAWFSESENEIHRLQAQLKAKDEQIDAMKNCLNCEYGETSLSILCDGCYSNNRINWQLKANQ